MPETLCTTFNMSIGSRIPLVRSLCEVIVRYTGKVSGGANTDHILSEEIINVYQLSPNVDPLDTQKVRVINTRVSPQ